MNNARWPVVLTTLAVLAVVEPAGAALYVVGVGAGCTHATVQAAVDDGALTSEADTILVARNTTYNGQAISIDNQSLTILGGVPNCTNFLPSGHSVLSGAGGSADPVIRITGSGNVTLSRIDLTGGDESDTGLGGGLFFDGGGVLRLEEMNILNNRAGSGGGVYARGTSSAAELSIGPNVLISNNTAVRNGGGIDAVDIRLTMTSPGSAVFLNTATGRIVNNELVDGDGGGIQCFGCQARIGTATALGTFFLNTAYGRGGGLAIFAKSGSNLNLTMDLFTSVATSPLVIWGNSAGIRGGAIYAESQLSSTTGAFDVTVRLWDAIVRDNLAPEGAAAFLKGDNDIFEDTRAELRMGVGTRPAGAVPCAAASRPCNRISANESRDLAGVATNGAILEGESADTVFHFENVLLEDNVGRSLLRKSSGPTSILRGCLLTGNTVAEELIQNVTSTDLVINHCTITSNQVGGTHVVFAEADTVIGHSIIWQPGKRVLRRTNTGAFLNVRNLLVNDIDGLPPQVDILSAATPGFVSVADRDYHLGPDSIAVDFAQYAFGTDYDMTRDLDGGVREVDVPEISNEFGPRDLGAYEMQSFVDLIFKDGFE